MRVTLIHNPGAGSQGEGDARSLQKLLQAAGYRVRYQSSKDDGWKRALDAPAELVVVAGGDGTVARVAKTMVGRRTPLALLPSGTANNIARSLGLLDRPFEGLISGWQHARGVKLDIGVAAGPWGERYFVEGVGAGLFARLLAHPAKSKRKGVAGALRRLQQFAARCEPMDLAAVVDGKDVSGRYILLEALNLPYVGPNLHLAHDSRPGDGQFDVVMVTEAERDRLLHYLEQWKHNRERLAMLPTLRGRRLQIEWTGFELHIDDKLRPKENVEPEEIAGLVEARLDGATVEFLVPATERS